VTATLFGIVVFGDVPDGFTILGAGIIVASGLYVFRHESAGGRA
jgi:drug/metabolite transporter (DMT)-like permease